MPRILQNLMKSLLLGILLCLPIACATNPAPEELTSYPTAHHLNAELGFTLTLPQSWKPLAEQDLPPQTAGWQGPHRPKDRTLPPRFILTSTSPSRWTGGFDRMREAYVASHPSLTLTAEQSVDLPSGTAWEIVGTDDRYAYRVFFLTTATRAFILEFSAPVEKRSEYEIAQSVEPFP